jgi:hypothetical protein
LREVVYKFLLGSITSGVWTIVSGAFILADDRNQALWDKMSNDLVVDTVAQPAV